MIRKIWHFVIVFLAAVYLAGWSHLYPVVSTAADGSWIIHVSRASGCQ